MGGDGTVLYLDCGVGCTDLYMYQNPMHRTMHTPEKSILLYDKEKGNRLPL